MYTATTYCFTFPVSKKLYIKKKRRPRLFKLYQALYICKKLAADDDDYLGWGWWKIQTLQLKHHDAMLFILVLHAL